MTFVCVRCKCTVQCTMHIGNNRFSYFKNRHMEAVVAFEICMTNFLKGIVPRDLYD